MSRPLYLCLRIAEFAAQALVRLRPEYRKAKIAVVEGVPPLETVCALNRLAARSGIRHGATKAELESFEELITLRRSTASESSAKTALLEAMAAFTPRMEEQPDAEAYALALDMSGSQRLFGSPAAIARKVLQTVRKMGFVVQIGASQNLPCALCAARSASANIVIVPAEREERFLAPLPLATLMPNDAQAQTLALWGLRNIGEFAALPDEEVGSRLGEEGKRLLLLARGQHQHLMVPHEPELRLSERVEFESPVESLDSLMFVLSSMLAQLLMRAQDRALALATISIRLELEGGATFERTIRPALPSIDRYALLKLIHLDVQANSPPAAVRVLNVTAEPGVRSKVQEGLFSPPKPEPMRLDVTLARIASIVGEGRVGRARILNTHKPDSFVVEKFCVREAGRENEQEKNQATIALRQLRPPREVEVVRTGEQLQAMRFNGVRYRIRKSAGPWRQSGDWWSPNVWSQEEWDVVAEAPSGERLVGLVVQDLRSRQWHLVGLYD